MNCMGCGMATGRLHAGVPLCIPCQVKAMQGPKR